MNRAKVAIIISFFLIIPAAIPLAFFFFAPDFRVCGTDNITYPSETEAIKRNIEISYFFPCQFPSSEKGLYERTEDIKITGQVIDFTENDFEMMVWLKENSSQKYYLASYFNDTKKPANFLPGDQVMISGKLNENTKLISINDYQNLSLDNNSLNNSRCEIVKIDINNDSIDCKTVDNNDIFTLTISAQTRIVSGLINPAQINDLKINDIIVARLNNKNQANLILVAKRGSLIYLKNHYFISKARFISLESSSTENYANIELESFPPTVDWAQENFDKNIIKIKILDNTILVKKYYGKIAPDLFEQNNELLIAGKINDDYSVEAITIKNNSIWR
jgi:hypothetical protein